MDKEKHAWLPFEYGDEDYFNYFYEVNFLDNFGEIQKNTTCETLVIQYDDATIKLWAGAKVIKTQKFKGISVNEQ
jgi:hypothetical protein